MSAFNDPNPNRRQNAAKAAIAAAFAAPDAAELIVGGDWDGFTRADATAWCWNLYQYEPHGFIYPNLVLRMRREEELESGGIPDGGGYAAKARIYVARGITPAQYREAREVVNSPTFSQTDVRYEAR